MPHKKNPKRIQGESKDFTKTPYRRTWQDDAEDPIIFESAFNLGGNAQLPVINNHSRQVHCQSRTCNKPYMATWLTRLNAQGQIEYSDNNSSSTPYWKPAPFGVRTMCPNCSKLNTFDIVE